MAAALLQELLADIRKGRAALAAQHARSQVAMRPEDVKAIHTEMKVGSVVTHQDVAGRPELGTSTPRPLGQLHLRNHVLVQMHEHGTRRVTSLR